MRHVWPETGLASVVFPQRPSQLSSPVGFAAIPREATMLLPAALHSIPSHGCGPIVPGPCDCHRGRDGRDLIWGATRQAAVSSGGWV